MCIKLGNWTQFRDAFANKGPFGIPIRGLLEGALNPYRIDTGETALHLVLGVKNAWSEIDKLPREPWRGPAPVEPQVIARTFYSSDRCHRHQLFRHQRGRVEDVERVQIIIFLGERLEPKLP